MRKKRKVAALFLVVFMILSSVTVPDPVKAYSIENIWGQNHVSDLSEEEIKALDEVSVTDLQMLDDIVERSYHGDFQDKTYIIKTEDAYPDQTYWKPYVHSRGDFYISLIFNSGRYIAKTDDYSYHMIRVQSWPGFSPYDSKTKEVDRYEEYNDRIQQIEKEIGLLDGNLCDYQKAQLAGIWIQQNVKNAHGNDDGTYFDCTYKTRGQEAIEAVLCGSAVCAGYARLFNRFMHDCGIDSYWVDLFHINHAINIYRFGNMWYSTDLQPNILTCDPGYEMYNKNGKLIWFINGVNQPDGTEAELREATYEGDAIIHYYDGDFVETDVDTFYDYWGDIEPSWSPLQEITFPENATCNTEGTFLKEGQIDEHCDFCGEVHEFPITKGHTYKTIETKYPTCSEEGYRKKVCTVCGDETTEVLEKTAHSYEISAYEANCVEEGSFNIICKTCGDVYYQDFTPKTEHTMSDWKEYPYNKGWECRGCLNPIEDNFSLSNYYVEYRNIYTGEITTIQPTSDAVNPNQPTNQPEPTTDNNVPTTRPVETTDNITKPNDSESQPVTTVKNEVTTRGEQSTTPGVVTTTNQTVTSQTSEQPTSKQVPTTTKSVSKPGKVTVKSVKNKAKKAVSVSWKKARNAKKYQIQYSVNKKFAKGVKSKTTKKLTYRMKGLTKSKTYYVRVRGVNGKNYGKWSKISKVKIKK